MPPLPRLALALATARMFTEEAIADVKKEVASKGTVLFSRKTLSMHWGPAVTLAGPATP